MVSFCQLLAVCNLPHRSRQTVQRKKTAGFPTAFLKASASVETLVEALDASAGIDQLLLAGEEGVALGADFNTEIRDGRTGLDGVAAGAPDNGGLIIGMNFLFHFFHLFKQKLSR